VIAFIVSLIVNYSTLTAYSPPPPDPSDELDYRGAEHRMRSILRKNPDILPWLCCTLQRDRLGRLSMAFPLGVWQKTWREKIKDILDSRWEVWGQFQPR